MSKLCEKCKDAEATAQHPSGAGRYCKPCLDEMIEAEQNPVASGYYYPGTMDRW